MSPIPKTSFSRSGILHLSKRVSRGRAESEKRDVTWHMVLTFGMVLIFLCVAATALSQNPSSKDLSSVQELDLRGKRVFEAHCATCHGLDGFGGEHAPDIIRRPGVIALSYEALLKVIHDGIPEEGMPGFASISGEDAQALVAYLRFLQGRTVGNSMPGDPARGHDLFYGKAGCSACHQIGDPVQFVAGNLAGFARDHSADEIRDAILKPAEGPREAVTAVSLDGQKFSGTIRNEDNASFQLQDGDGRFYLLMKSSLVSVQRKIGDPMPVDYGQRISSGELDDLVGYIVREASPPHSSSSPSVESHAQE